MFMSLVYWLLSMTKSRFSVIFLNPSWYHLWLVSKKTYFVSGNINIYLNKQVSQSVQLLSRVRLFATPWTTARQTSLSITNSRSPTKPMSIESVMPSNHLILSSPSPPALNLSQHQGLIQWVSSLHQVAKVLVLQLQHQSFKGIFRAGFL